MKLYSLITFNKFKKKIINAKYKLNKLINDAKKNNFKIAGYGAAAKTTTLLEFFKIRDDAIEFIVDDNKLKQNLYMPGKKIKIVNLKILKKARIDILIIFAWNYSDYIIKKIKNKNNNIKYNGKFLVPFPNPKITK